MRVKIFDWQPKSLDDLFNINVSRFNVYFDYLLLFHPRRYYSMKYKYCLINKTYNSELARIFGSSKNIYMYNKYI